MQKLWLIPLLPLAGFLLNGLFGRRLSKAVDQRGRRRLRAAGVPLGLENPERAGRFRRRQSMEHAYIEHYFTWIQSGALNIGVDFAVDRLTAVMLLIVTGIGSLIHIYAIGYMAHEGGYYRFFAYLNLFMFFMLTLVLARQLPAAVRRMGRRGPVQLPADRLLLQRKVRHRRRQQGVHREPHRRLRLLAGHVPDRDPLRLARFRQRCSAKCRRCRSKPPPAG